MQLSINISIWEINIYWDEERYVCIQAHICCCCCWMAWMIHSPVPYSNIFCTFCFVAGFFPNILSTIELTKFLYFFNIFLITSIPFISLFFHSLALCVQFSTCFFAFARSSREHFFFFFLLFYFTLLHHLSIAYQLTILLYEQVQIEFDRW